MSSTIASLLRSVDLEPAGWVPWGTPIPETRKGIYLVSLTATVDQIDGTRLTAPLSDRALDELIQACPDLALDGAVKPNRADLAERIAAFWLPDEPVLYIGLAGQPIRTRVRQYYKTPLGAAKPHSGGWWLKTLAILDQLYVHFAITDEFKQAEEQMLRTFAADVSDSTRVVLREGEAIMPFANLRDGNFRRRNHGITGARNKVRPNASAAKASADTSWDALHDAAGIGPAEQTTTPAIDTPSQHDFSGRDEPRLPSLYGGDLRAYPDRTEFGGRPVTELRDSVRRWEDAPRHSQKVTAKDIEAGQVRVPRAAKAILPRTRQDVAVNLRGCELSCRWDPRFGPPERSGVIRVGKAAARDLLRAGELLSISERDGVIGLD